MYDTMHLMYLACTFDESPMPHVQKGFPKLRQSYATNECQSVDRQILQMVLGLPIVIHNRENHWNQSCLMIISLIFVFRKYLQVAINVDDAHGKEREECWYNAG